MNDAAAPEPFSRVLIGCLVGPYAAYLGLALLAGFISFISGGGSIHGLTGSLALIAFLVQMGAVFVGVVKMVRQPRYRTAGNMIVTGVAAAPWVVALLMGIFVVGMKIHF